jgi:D-methionine transport system substrate-binding protein
MRTGEPSSRQKPRSAALNVNVVIFKDYTRLNEALEHGDVGANSFQHKPYLDNQIKTHGYHISTVGPAAVWPIGLYSHKHRTVAEVPSGAKIGVPNDPSNKGRALMLLEHVGLIELRESAAIVATATDIVAIRRKSSCAQPLFDHPYR